MTIGTLKKLREAGVIRADERVVAYVTGVGFKTIEALEERVGVTMTVSPCLEEFTDQLNR